MFDRKNAINLVIVFSCIQVIMSLFGCATDQTRGSQTLTSGVTTVHTSNTGTLAISDVNDENGSLILRRETNYRFSSAGCEPIKVLCMMRSNDSAFICFNQAGRCFAYSIKLTGGGGQPVSDDSKTSVIGPNGFPMVSVAIKDSPQKFGQSLQPKAEAGGSARVDPGDIGTVTVSAIFSFRTGALTLDIARADGTKASFTLGKYSWISTPTPKKE